MSKRFVKEIKPYCNLYIDDNTGIAWIEDGSTGNGHSVHPNIDITGSVKGMKKLGYWKKHDKIVRSHGFQYNVSVLSVSDDLDKIVLDYCDCVSCRERRNKIKEDKLN